MSSYPLYGYQSAPTQSPGAVAGLHDGSALSEYSPAADTDRDLFDRWWDAAVVAAVTGGMFVGSAIAGGGIP